MHSAVNHRVVLFQVELRLSQVREVLDHLEEGLLVSMLDTVGHQLVVTVVFLLAYLENLFVEGRLVEQVKNGGRVELGVVEEVGVSEVLQHLGGSAFGEHVAESVGVNFGETGEHLEDLLLGHGDGGAGAVDRGRLDFERAGGGEVEEVGEGVGGEGGEDLVDLVGVLEICHGEGLVRDLEDDLEQLFCHTAVRHGHLAPVDSIHHKLLHLLLHPQTLLFPVLVQTVVEPLGHQNVFFQLRASQLELFVEHQCIAAALDSKLSAIRVESGRDGLEGEVE